MNPAGRPQPFCTRTTNKAHAHRVHQGLHHHHLQVRTRPQEEQRVEAQLEQAAMVEEEEEEGGPGQEWLFLGQLITALERYLVPSWQGTLGVAGSGGRPRVTTAATTKSKAGSASSTTLSAELVQLNTGIVYEILEECMGLGYPLMPSLAQLDLLVFGVPKAAS
ncbi:hypothetical protein KI688_005805 [Linnemannia hyalina]|uniref:Uncharacterized protein n=1 Tax=Linnemannia hyalina TaxID=64524 RepID=A0A9P8BZI5_9FUNG|nr:hypothetical protein KI688_005805 [Linnemannia hyalina]